MFRNYKAIKILHQSLAKMLANHNSSCRSQLLPFLLFLSCTLGRASAHTIGSIKVCVQAGEGGQDPRIVDGATVKCEDDDVGTPDDFLVSGTTGSDGCVTIEYSPLLPYVTCFISQQCFYFKFVTSFDDPAVELDFGIVEITEDPLQCKPSVSPSPSSSSRPSSSSTPHTPPTTPSPTCYQGPSDPQACDGKLYPKYTSNFHLSSTMLIHM